MYNNKCYHINRLFIDTSLWQDEDTHITVKQKLCEYLAVNI